MLEMNNYVVDPKCYIVNKRQPWLMCEADGLTRKDNEYFCLEAKCCNANDCLTSYDQLDWNQSWSQRVYWHQVQMTMLISGRRCYYSYLDSEGFKNRFRLARFRKHQ